MLLVKKRTKNKQKKNLEWPRFHAISVSGWKEILLNRNGTIEASGITFALCLLYLQLY